MALAGVQVDSSVPPRVEHPARLQQVAFQVHLAVAVAVAGELLRGLLVVVVRASEDVSRRERSVRSSSSRMLQQLVA